jgi:ribokinase
MDLTSFSARLPSKGETVPGYAFSMVPGGKGANQALASARMGAPTWMVGCVGEDAFQATVRDSLTAAGVSTEYVRTVPGQSTGIAHIRVDAHGDNDIVIVPLANESVTRQDIETSLRGLRTLVRVALVQLEIPLDVALHALVAARENGMMTVLDPAPVPDSALPEGAYESVDVVTPNETEASRLTGIEVVDVESARLAGEWFLARGSRAAIITLGALGAVTVSRDGGARTVSPLPVKAVDSTAAGDAFTGALGSRLAAGEPLATALSWAAAAGALATTVRGASSSIPDHVAVREFLGLRPSDTAGVEVS